MDLIHICPSRPIGGFGPEIISAKSLCCGDIPVTRLAGHHNLFPTCKICIGELWKRINLAREMLSIPILTTDEQEQLLACIDRLGKFIPFWSENNDI